jgi:glycosyltransferase involved in cell wall biosynthesis
MCCDCPQLVRSGPRDLSQRLFQKKQSAWQALDLTLAAPSNWLAACASQSSLFSGKRIEVVPTGIDIDKFQPKEKQSVRRELRLPANRKLILFGAINATSYHRKGFDLLHNAIQNLSQDTREQVEILVFGSNKPDNPPDFGLRVHYLGRILDDERLVSIYSAADVMIVPSREDNLPNTAVESLACGTPVVAFDVGGMSDIVDHLGNGYLAPAFDVERMAKGIEWVLAEKNRYQIMSKEARTKVEDNFDIAATVNRYRSVYQSIL